MYPDYVPRDKQGFRRLLKTLRRSGNMAFPYLNGLLWDTQLSAFSDMGPHVGVRDTSNRLVRYNDKLPSLRYACPSCAAWQNTIVQSRNAIQDSDGYISTGIYLDMLLAAPPLLCWSEHHSHAPGDPTAWQTGIKAILSLIGGSIMSEGCAEPYLDRVDYALMHLYSQRNDSVPLWAMVYGNLLPSVGWSLPDSITESSMSVQLKKARSFGVSAMGSPWMTTQPEADILPMVEKAMKHKATNNDVLPRFFK
jgi:hypothetical protein